MVVCSEFTPHNNSFLKIKNIGFQVKKPKMSSADIKKEMCLSDGVTVKNSIKYLIDNQGAYIIVSSTENTTDKMLRTRIDAMRDAVKNEANHKDLHIDFFDRGRVATWVRNHPSIILWVRKEINDPLTGWKPYENWSNPTKDITEEYLIDDTLRVFNRQQKSDESSTASDGLQQIRSILLNNGVSVRLVGLSGVGKTRFVQALFDNRIGINSLNPSEVFYTDISSNPEPTPLNFAQQLIDLKKRCILIVDNCTDELHSQLTTLCNNTFISLLTVEYDVRDDISGKTDVFSLEPASPEIITNIILNRFDYIDRLNAQIIADMSGGNARIAIALANTVNKGEDLSKLRDTNLFERLFWQRNNPNDSLLKSARVCSLLYSFDGDNFSDTSELAFLASFIQKNATALYADISELKKRELLQSRDIWRAVLPHAIANRLAAEALEMIPKKILIDKMLNQSERIIKSFTRRLSYLHDSNEAMEIVDEWLKPDGWLGKKNCCFSEFDMTIFKNIAPISPKKILETIERANNADKNNQFSTRENGDFYEFVNILRYLAYDDTLFEPSVHMICWFALSEKHNDSIRNILKSFFYLYLSGTHASAEKRGDIIKGFLCDDNTERQNLGLELLCTSLSTGNFTSHYDHSFGARPRDYGYRPKTGKEEKNWYQFFTNIAVKYAISESSQSHKARKILANRLRGLCQFGMINIVEDIAKSLHNIQPWNEGWIAVRQTIYFADSKNVSADIISRLQALETLLKPSDLLEITRAFVIHNNYDFGLLDENNKDDNVHSCIKLAEKAYQLGQEIAQIPEHIDILLPELMITKNSYISYFSKGLANGILDKKSLWDKLYKQFIITSEDTQNIDILTSYLLESKETDKEFYDTTLDNLLTDAILAKFFPLFQKIGTIDEKGLKRLHYALDNNIADISLYYSPSPKCSDDDLVLLLEKIMTKEGGIYIVIHILSIKFIIELKENISYPDALIKLSQRVLCEYPFLKETNSSNSSYNLTKIAEVCLKQGTSIDIVKNILSYWSRNIGYSFNYSDLLTTFAKLYPVEFLDIFTFCDGVDFNNSKYSQNPYNQIDDTIIIEWCEHNPIICYPLIIEKIETFAKPSETKDFDWKFITYAILKKEPELSKILRTLEDVIMPMSWSGSLADVMESRLILFQKLYSHENTRISNWAKNQHDIFKNNIETRRKLEKQRDRGQFQSFE